MGAEALDHLRRSLMLEPRGHADMYGALLTEPVTPGAHAGVLFMHNEGWSTMCGHGVIAVTTIAIERELIWPGGPELVLDSPAGPIEATGDRRPTAMVIAACRAVAFRNVPSFVFEAGLPVDCRRADASRSTSRSAARSTRSSTPKPPGWRSTPSRLAELRRLGMEIKRGGRAAAAGRRIRSTQDCKGIYGTIFTAPAQHPDAHLRNVTIFADAEVDRSPCGTGTAAVMAVLSEMGVLAEDAPFVHESIVGTLFIGRIAGDGRWATMPAIVPEIQGSAWITGEHTFLIDGDDPLRGGLPSVDRRQRSSSMTCQLARGFI